MSARRKIAALLFSLVVIGGVWALADSVEKGPLRIIADTDTPVPGGEGATFAGFFQLNGLSPDISGRNIVFMACCPPGVYSWFDGELGVIADLDSTFPGTDNPLGFAFTSPSISGENVAFSCRNGRPGFGAVCAHINGRLESIAEGSVTLVPGTNETFGTFFSLNGVGPSISGTNVAFAASSDFFNGIYARINGELITIADNNTPVPGQEELTFQNFGQLNGLSPSISGENVAFFGFWFGGGGSMPPSTASCASSRTASRIQNLSATPLLAARKWRFSMAELNGESPSTSTVNCKWSWIETRRLRGARERSKDSDVRNSTERTSGSLRA